MNAQSSGFLARGRVDADDRLIEADEPIAGLQRQCGGEIPGPLAIPALRNAIGRARMAGRRFGTGFEAQGDDEIVRARVEIFPHTDRGGECSIGVTDWQVSPVPGESDAQAATRRLEIERNVAELWARLDSAQCVLAVETQAPDLEPLGRRMRERLGYPWTDFVELPGTVHRQPLHWRLLDDTRVRVPESQREWKVVLAPLGPQDRGSRGFDLFLVADSAPVPGRPESGAEPAAPPVTRRIGQELSPVLRQPIARIIANAETIRTRLAGPLAEEYSNYAADIAAAGQHLLALIDDLSDLEVVESEDFATAPDRIDLGDVARRAAGILAVRARERHIELVAPEEGQSVPAIAEFRRVLQILLNLLGNAIRYAPEGSTVRLKLSARKGRARVSVIDQGAGLSAEQQARVFEKFERLGRSGDGGSGLGLYISRRLARAMGGDLSVKSKPGQGASFRLDLPLDRAKSETSSG
ncbi:HAMP domain-containing sensor histidine kinase [Pelagerythrobacter marensis]|uniref:histidine kinase n=1 Tax=Pelagerythrobacter marensis TaxID=543877 RepID=A0ABZ2D0G8_9SPHN